MSLTEVLPECEAREASDTRQFSKSVSASQVVCETNSTASPSGADLSK